VTNFRIRKQKPKDFARDAGETAAVEGTCLGGCCLLDSCLGSLPLAGVAWRVARRF